MELKRVVVTGLGAVTPVGNSVEEMWSNLLAGKSGAAPITSFDTTNFKTKFACEVKDLNVNDYIDRKEARKMDRCTQLAMISAIQAVKDSGMDLETVDKNRVGVVYGIGIGGIKTFQDEVVYYGQHMDRGPMFNPFFIPKPPVRALRHAMLWLTLSTCCAWARLMSSWPEVPRLPFATAVSVVSTP